MKTVRLSDFSPYDRDMGNLGEGCLISAFIWLIIMLAIIGVFCLY